LSPADRFPGEVLARLARFGRVHVMDELPSTNDYAFGLAATREPAVVIARRQARGRGRFGRSWFSDPDSLTFSVLLFFSPEEQAALVARLTQLAGLAVCRAVEDVTGLAPLIRWPNDIVHKDRKLCGILCEQRREAVVTGIGLNVNQPAFPEDLPEAGSLRIATGRSWEPLALAESILGHLFACIDRLRAGADAQLLGEVKDRSATLHRRVEVRTLFRRHIGTVVDLDAEGRIVLRAPDGRLTVINAGQVRGLS